MIVHVRFMTIRNAAHAGMFLDPRMNVQMILMNENANICFPNPTYNNSSTCLQCLWSSKRFGANFAEVSWIQMLDSMIFQRLWSGKLHVTRIAGEFLLVPMKFMQMKIDAFSGYFAEQTNQLTRAMMS